MNPYLVPALEFGPAVLERLLDLIPATRYDEAIEAGRFTVREVVAHLADWEPILLQRVRSAVEEEMPTIAVHDEEKRAIDNHYADLDIHHELAAYRARRKETAAYLRALPKEAFERTFKHPERGVMTVADQANMLLGHDLYHIDQLSMYLGDKTAATW